MFHIFKIYLRNTTNTISGLFTPYSTYQYQIMDVDTGASNKTQAQWIITPCGKQQGSEVIKNKQKT